MQPCGNSLLIYVHVAKLPPADVRLVADSPADVLPGTEDGVCVCVETDLYHCLIFGLITVRLLVLYQLTREYVRHAGESKAHNLKDCDPTKRICPHWRCR